MNLVSISLLAVMALVPGAPAPTPVPGGARTAPVAVGDAAPDFTLRAHDGSTVMLSKRLADGPAVVVFYRGYWCPFCGRQLSELRSLLRKDERVTLLAVSVDDPETSKTFASKIAADGKGPVSFPLLSDPGHATIDAYGLHDAAYDGQEFEGIPHAAVYVIGRDGRVAWARVSDDYRKRPSIAEIRTALETLGVK